MGIIVTPSGAVCGAHVTGVDLTQNLSSDLIAELRAIWLKHKVLAFPNQKLSNLDLERLTVDFGGFGEDPFFGSIDGSNHIAAIQRDADETTPIFAEIFHTDWSFLDVPPSGTMLYGLKIPPMGGNTLFADQVEVYKRLPDEMREKAENLTAIHSARLGYSKDGAYGDGDHGRSMKILPSDKALEEREHPFVRTHPETGEKALYSSPAYIMGFKDMSLQESQLLMMEFYRAQTDEAVIYSHKWEKDMLVIWDNRSLLHAATGGYAGHDRLLHRTTIADVRF